MSTVPLIEVLDTLDTDGFVDAVEPLFEGAPRFCRRLAGERPFGTEDALLEAAGRVALAMPEDEQRELLDAHPRLGADPGSVSPLSYREQGYDRQAPAADVAAELAELNDAYERRFGFRFVVHVAGRSRAELVPVMRAALDGERPAELRRGLEDAVSIADDRLRGMRASAAPAEARR
jgi:2-oxo-4-hydroxy-4-carboxy--5-ureidoimidazoline (OHCU) decarboxylase